MQILKRVYFDSMEQNDTTQCLKDCWTKEMINNNNTCYYTNLTKDRKNFL